MMVPHGAGDEARAALVARIYELFRDRGFDGVSIADISAETGLGKSSLYHHFPGGKDDMAAAVAASAQAWLAASVFAPLRAPVGRARRIEGMLTATDTLFGGGTSPCLVASLMVGRPEGPLGATLAAIFRDWIAEIAAALVATGSPKAKAEAKARFALAHLEGGLLVARALDDRQHFAEAVRIVRAELLDGR